jgi:hypothetical protein
MEFLFYYREDGTRVVNHFVLSSFEAQDTPDGDMLILISGSKKYYTILRNAFRGYRFSIAFDDKRKRFNWGTYIYHIPKKERIKLLRLLELFREVVCIDDALDQTFALGYHGYATYDEYVHTDIGQLVNAAKPYDKPVTIQHKENALKLVDHFVKFINLHPSYRKSAYLVPVPPNPSKPFDLPTFIVDELSKNLKIKNGSECVRKIKQTSMKNCVTLKQKSDEIQGAFEVSIPSPSMRQVGQGDDGECRRAG